MAQEITVSAETDRQYVLRRVVSGAVVVASFHPVIGPAFWEFVDESGVGLPDDYGLTTCIDAAHRFAPARVPFADFRRRIEECCEQVLVEIGTPEDEDYLVFEAGVPRGDFSRLAQRAHRRREDGALVFVDGMGGVSSTGEDLVSTGLQRFH